MKGVVWQRTILQIAGPYRLMDFLLGGLQSGIAR